MDLTWRSEIEETEQKTMMSASASISSLSSPDSNLTTTSTTPISISQVPFDPIFKGVLTKKAAAKLVQPGEYITFYPIPNTKKPIPAKIHLFVAQKIYSHEVAFMELSYNEFGWFVLTAREPRPSFDSLKKLLEFYNTYSYLNINTPLPTKSSTSTRTVFE